MRNMCYNLYQGQMINSMDFVNSNLDYHHLCLLYLKLESNNNNPDGTDSNRKHGILCIPWSF